MKRSSGDKRPVGLYLNDSTFLQESGDLAASVVLLWL